MTSFLHPHVASGSRLKPADDPERPQSCWQRRQCRRRRTVRTNRAGRSRARGCISDSTPTCVASLAARSASQCGTYVGHSRPGGSERSAGTESRTPPGIRPAGVPNRSARGPRNSTSSFNAYSAAEPVEESPKITAPDNVAKPGCLASRFLAMRYTATWRAGGCLAIESGEGESPSGWVGHTYSSFGQSAMRERIAFSGGSARSQGRSCR